MRFSFWPEPAQPYADVLALAQHVERTGWDGFWYADHFMPDVGEPSTPSPAEAWVTLAAIGAQVPRLQLGTLVAGNTYRHPAVLAKMAATLDHITGGRVTLGLGTGWQENEHRQYGIEFDSVAGRLQRLDEACAVIKALFSEPKANFSGKHYQLSDASLEPKPVQKPLPLLVGGGGEKVTLKITAKYADAWNTWGDPELMAAKGAILDDHCAAFGRDPKSIHRTAVALLFMSEDDNYLRQMRDANIVFPHIIGTPAEVRDTVAAYQAAGVAELIVPDFTLGAMPDKLATLDTFIREVADR